MFFRLFLLFTVVPLAELALLVWLGGQTEWWVPILIILADAVLGASLIRWQGWRAITRIQDDLRAGRMPTDAVIDGVLVLAGGLLLITPGMLTDVAGFALLIPPVRALVKRAAQAWAAHHIQVRVGGNAAKFWSNAAQPSSQDGPSLGGHIPSRGKIGDQIIDARVIDTHVEDAH